jgi:hypothetical protein
VNKRIKEKIIIIIIINEKKIKERATCLSMSEKKMFNDYLFSFVLNQIVLFEVQLKDCVFNSSKHKSDILGIYKKEEEKNRNIF